MDGVGGCRIVYGGIGSLHVDLQALMKVTNLHKVTACSHRRRQLMMLFF